MDEFIENNVTGVGFYRVPDGRTLSEAEVAAILRAERVGVWRQRAARFRSFVWQMSCGDVVVMPDTPRGEVVIGEINGDYHYRSELPVERYRHRRAVQWLGRHPHSDLPRGREEIYRQRQSLRELDAPDIADHVVRVRRGEVGRAASDQGRSTKKRARKTPGGAGMATGIVARAELCPGCGQLRVRTQLAAHGGVCADCAHDS